MQSGYAPSSHLAEGVGLVALTNSRSVDLLTPDTWRGGPTTAGSDNTEVGVGWRRNSMSAVVGYVRENANSEPGAFTNEGEGRFKSRAMMGMGFALHY